MAKNGNGTRNGDHNGKRTPTLIAVGGHEEKQGKMVSLRKVAQAVGHRRLVVATLASEEADAMWNDYRRVFRELGVKDVVHLNVDQRIDSANDERNALLQNAGGVFFTGGDQLRITSK